MNISNKTILILLCLGLLSSCASKKKRGSGEPSKLSKFYHNTTAYYNGYFNANELLDESYAALEDAHIDNYTDVISVYNYNNAPDAKAVNPDLDKAIEKVVKVAALHENSKWIDDCYVLMGEAQYIKQDYETAEETLLYFQDEFNPNNPNGRNYKNAKPSKKEKKKAREEERKLEQKQKEEEKKARAEEREAKKKAKEEERKAQEKARKEERDAKRKAREAEKKRRDKERKKNKKRRGKKKRAVKKRTETPKEETTTEEKATEKKETPKAPVVEKKVEPKNETKEVEEAVEEDEPINVKPKKKEPKKDETKAYQKGQLLLAQTLVERDNYSSALFILDKLSRDGVMDKEVQRTIPVVKADIFIKEKSYDQAIASLKEAMELADKKKLKARYAFIIGQLTQRNGNYKEAAQYFASAKSLAKDFDMKFAAELQTEKNDMLCGNKSRDEVDSKLARMLKEDKYIEQRDQIYFVKGEINLEQDKYAEATENFSKSIRNNVSNEPLKVETYLKLGDLFYAKPEYGKAKNYYDSTLMLMNAKHEKHLKVKTLSENLTDIAKNLEVIELNDSLIRLSKLSDAELRKIAQNLKENEKPTKASEARKNDQTGRPGIFTSTNNVFGKSSFPFYDAGNRERAKLSFTRKWGDRPLVDNWRRESAIEGVSISEDTGEIVDSNADTEAELDQAVRNLKAKLPFSASVRNSVNGKIETAYYILGTQFRTKIEDYKSSNEALETLIRRFPSTIHKLEAYYYLYLNHKSLGNMSTANKYKELILNDYAESNFAKVIKDPSYADDLRAEENQLEAYYQSTYKLFEQGEYRQVISRCEQSIAAFGKENELHRKFELLKVMSVGSTEGKDTYINGLRNFIQRYPGTEEQTRASELLRLLNGEEVQLDVKAADDAYVKAPDATHYIAVVIYDSANKAARKTSYSISNFNKKYFKSKRYRISNVGLSRDDDSEIVFIRTFKTEKDARTYYDEVKKSEKEFVGDHLKDYSIYIITQANYRRLLQDKSDVRYKKFFEENY